jgi:hypothetical protein
MREMINVCLPPLCIGKSSSTFLASSSSNKRQNSKELSVIRHARNTEEDTANTNGTNSKIEAEQQVIWRIRMRRARMAHPLSVINNSCVMLIIYCVIANCVLKVIWSECHHSITHTSGSWKKLHLNVCITQYGAITRTTIYCYAEDFSISLHIWSTQIY